jgi:hypothetical protein
MADIERALGRPERAIELTRGPEARELDRAQSIELAIVAAGARRDLGELDAAVVGLQLPELDPSRRDPWSPRLFYAYADNLLAAGRTSEAVEWFVRTADIDSDGGTDAAVRLAELTGEPVPDDEDDVLFVGEDTGAADDSGSATDVTTPVTGDSESDGDSDSDGDAVAIDDTAPGDDDGTAVAGVDATSSDDDTPAGDETPVGDDTSAGDDTPAGDDTSAGDDTPASAADPVSARTAAPVAAPAESDDDVR